MDDGQDIKAVVLAEGALAVGAAGDSEPPQPQSKRLRASTKLRNRSSMFVSLVNRCG